ncbi:MAG: hypothetical protein ACJ75F_01855 [Flavisolibacter sp.]|jgi:hypothetical protein
MGKIVFYNEYRNSDQFRIDYPYYGLFGSANVTRLLHDQEMVFECALLNGSIITVKKSGPSNKWIDMAMNHETPLSATIGISIEDFLRKNNPE